MSKDIGKSLTVASQVMTLDRQCSSSNPDLISMYVPNHLFSPRTDTHNMQELLAVLQSLSILHAVEVTTLQGEGDFIAANVNQSGYYRVLVCATTLLEVRAATAALARCIHLLTCHQEWAPKYTRLTEYLRAVLGRSLASSCT